MSSNDVVVTEQDASETPEEQVAVEQVVDAAEGTAEPQVANWRAALGRLTGDLEQLGQAGKQQWEQVLGRSRATLRREEGGFKPWETLLERPELITAQERGATLLLGAVTRVRTALEGAESSLREFRQREVGAADGSGTPTAA